MLTFSLILVKLMFQPFLLLISITGRILIRFFRKTSILRLPLQNLIILPRKTLPRRNDLNILLRYTRTVRMQPLIPRPHRIISPTEVVRKVLITGVDLELRVLAAQMGAGELGWGRLLIHHLWVWVGLGDSLE